MTVCVHHHRKQKSIMDTKQGPSATKQAEADRTTPSKRPAKQQQWQQLREQEGHDPGCVAWRCVTHQRDRFSPWHSCPAQSGSGPHPTIWQSQPSRRPRRQFAAAQRCVNDNGGGGGGGIGKVTDLGFNEMPSWHAAPRHATHKPQRAPHTHTTRSLPALPQRLVRSFHFAAVQW